MLKMRIVPKMALKMRRDSPDDATKHGKHSSPLEDDKGERAVTDAH